MSEQMNVRVSHETRRKVEILTTKYGTIREVIAIAVDRLYHTATRQLTLEENHADAQ